MKKLLSIAICASAVAAFADPTEVTLGSVGVTAVSSSYTNTVVAVSYTDLAAGGDITISNIVKTTNLTNGDLLYVFTGSGYESYTLATSGDVRYWSKTANYSLSSAGLGESAGSDPSSTTIGKGLGLWLIRHTGSEGDWDGTSSFTFYLYGATNAVNTSSVTAGSTALIGNPTQANKVPVITGMAVGDRVLVPTNNTIPTTYTRKAAGWAYTDENHIRQTQEAFPATIKAGTGFWYISKGSSNVSVAW